jgi:GDP-L-fucose synthase
MTELNKKIYIAGHTGMVGSAIKRNLERRGYSDIVTRSKSKLNLIHQKEVDNFFVQEKPEWVIIAAAKVGGILANNTYRAEFLYDNLMIEANIIHAAYRNHAEKLIFLGSSCIYPRSAKQPLKEEYLFNGPLEHTNEPYALAKIAGIKLCENYYRQYRCNFVSVMPTNLYGHNDNYNVETSHVIPALIRKFHEATIQNSGNTNQGTVVIWGTGKPYREFLYVEDLADAIHFIMNNMNASDLYDKGISHINIGTGNDITINDLAKLIADVVGFSGSIEYDATKPDGTPRKLLDVTHLHNFGWKHETSLQEGLRKTYQWFVDNYYETITDKELS